MAIRVGEIVLLLVFIVNASAIDTNVSETRNSIAQLLARVPNNRGPVLSLPTWKPSKNYAPACASSDCSTWIQTIPLLELQIPPMTIVIPDEGVCVVAHNRTEQCVIQEIESITVETTVSTDIISLAEYTDKVMSSVAAKRLSEETIKYVKPVRDPETSINYASTDCGAKIISANPEAKDVHHVLHVSRDKYMLNECVASKWLVIELCEEVQVDSIQIANYELFSSMVKDFVLLASREYPPKKWILLGNFTASNIRQKQSFDVEQEDAPFVKYVRVGLLTHHGNELYCPLSKIVVLGTTVVEHLSLQVQRDEAEVKIVEEQLLAQNGNGDARDVTEKSKSTENTIEPLTPRHSGTIEPTEMPKIEQPLEGLLDKLTNMLRGTAVIDTEQRQDNGDSSSGDVVGASASSKAINEQQIKIDPTPVVTHQEEAQGAHKDRTIFQTITAKIKKLEINQSLSYQYLKDLREGLNNKLNEIKGNLGNLTNRLNKLERQFTLVTTSHNKTIRKLKEESKKELENHAQQILKESLAAMARQHQVHTTFLLWFMGSICLAIFVLMGIITMYFYKQNVKLQLMLRTPTSLQRQKSKSKSVIGERFVKRSLSSNSMPKGRLTLSKTNQHRRQLARTQPRKVVK